jgi:hypothetical protein
MRTNGEYSQRILSGPEAVMSADILQREEESRQLWPFPWVYPPKNAKRRTPTGSVAVPAIGSAAQILAFTVPTNFSFVWRAVIITSGPGFSPVPGDITYTLDVDTPVTGSAPLTSSPMADFQAMTIGLGSINPWAVCELPRAEVIASGQILRAKGTNVASGSAGAPNFLVAMFLGWLVPAGR